MARRITKNPAPQGGMVYPGCAGIDICNDRHFVAFYSERSDGAG